MEFFRMQPSARTTLSIYALAYFASFGNPLVIPLLPFIAQDFGLTPMELGLMISIYALPGVAVIPVLGVLEDRFGRKPVLLCALVVCAVSSFMCFLSPNYGWLVFWRGAQGLSVTPLEALYNTLVTDNFHGAERTRQIGRCAAILYVGVSTFPLLSGVVQAAAGWRASFLLPVVMAVPLFMLWFRRPMRYNASEAPPISAYLRQVRSLLMSSTLLSLYGVRIVMALIMFGVVYSYMPLLVTDRLQASPHLVGGMFACYSAALAVSCLLAGRVTHGMPWPRIGMGCGLIMAAGLGGMWACPSIEFLPLPLVVYGSALGLVTALVTVNVALCCTPDTRGTILSLFSTLFRASQAAAPLMGGVLFLAGGYDLLFGCAVVMACILGLQCRSAFRKAAEQRH